MASKVAEKRLQKEYLAMQRSPPPFIWASPEEKNILDWHFIIRGPPDSPYDGGEYHGLIMFPSDYPFKPPDVKLFTPSGRFEVGHKICMSMTSYHPSTWNAAWSVATILTGLLSFMLSDEITAGATKSTEAQKKAFAKESHAFNLKSKKFRDIFPAYATPEMTDLPDMGNSTSKPHLKPLSSAASSLPSSAPSTRIPTPAPPQSAKNPNVQDDDRQTNTSGTVAGQGMIAKRDDPTAIATAARRWRWWLSWKVALVVLIVAFLSRLSRGFTS